MIEILKAPPHSHEAEQSVLGALLVDNQSFERVADVVSAEDFYSDSHRRIYRHLSRLIEAGKPADVVTTWESIASSEDKDKTGGPAYLGEIAQNTPSAYNARRYAELVRDKALLRAVASQATAVADRALSGSESPLQIAGDAAATFAGLQNATESGRAESFGAAVVEAVEWLDNPAKGLFTGWPKLDAIVRGLMPGDLIVIAGRPSMGKSALAMNIAEHVAAQSPVVVFSIEMTRRKIAARSLKYHASILGRDGAVDHLDGLKLFIDDSASLSIAQARARLRLEQQKHGVSLAVFDYLQMMNAKAEKRHEEVASVSRGLKALAKEFAIPVIAVSQLNRASEGRVDNRPQLSDLRESGQIEQDADVIAFVYREEYYKPETPWRGIAEVIVRKNRDGPIGTAYLEFVSEFTRFRNLERSLPAPEEPEPPKKNVFDFKSRAAGDEAA